MAGRVTTTPNRTFLLQRGNEKVGKQYAWPRISADQRWPYVQYGRGHFIGAHKWRAGEELLDAKWGSKSPRRGKSVAVFPSNPQLLTRTLVHSRLQMIVAQPGPVQRYL